MNISQIIFELPWSTQPRINKMGTYFSSKLNHR